MTLRTARRRRPHTMTSTIKRTLTSAAVALCALFVSVGAYADEPKRRDESRPAGLQERPVPRHDRLEPARVRPHRLRPRPRLRPRHLPAAQEAAGPQVDARDLRADLRDLQDVPQHAGQVHPHARAAHRRRHRRLLRRAAQGRHPRDDHHPRLQRHRHRRLRRRRLVRHPRQHLRQLAHRVRLARGKPFPTLRRSRSRPACRSACCSSRSSSS